MTTPTTKPRSGMPSSYGIDIYGRKRIAAIATELVIARMAAGEVEESDEAVEAATLAALCEAREVYLAALDFVSK